MAYADPITLRDEIVSLVPLSSDHEADLKEASEDGELWKLWYTTVPKPEDMGAEISRRLDLQKAGSMCPFAIVDNASGKAVGMTTYMNIDEANRRLEIGSTWYRKSVQRGGFNTRCKLMLLTHAFEEFNCNAVEFCTHFMNRQSRAAIERLGAKLDGILRSHKMMPDGSLRDTCVYSILAHEWPTVKTHLTFQRDKTR
ncbi:GNAT family N-acetyltransferase [Sneathiella sp. P13V-1]|uniref:GNAT family N-acetyltransferase n=1 Tax=Sneathiella sp. P13V-1 TaxID=2697366 RepID=UPI00187BB960|nr:GNAT family protein [Sneathiella sp. P13V-1]MBE7635834.1 GNAT family N-acetyltransferase [Sneathiella sp. P13V-1]